MKKKALGFPVIFLAAFIMFGCAGEDVITYVTRYVIPGVEPVPQRSLQELVDYHGGVHFQNHVNISLRFFEKGADGYGVFQRWGIGLGNIAPNFPMHGNRYRIAGNRIYFYFDPADGPRATTHRHVLTYRMEGQSLVFVAGFAGTHAAPTDVFTRPATVTIVWDEDRMVNIALAGQPANYVNQPGYVSVPSTQLVPQFFTRGNIPDFQGW